MLAEIDSASSPPNPPSAVLRPRSASASGRVNVVIGDGGGLRGDGRLRPQARVAAALDGSRSARHARGRARVRPWAAQLARPGRPRAVLVYGDGSFGLHGIEFEAMARQNIPVVAIIGNDAGWTQIRRGQVGALTARSGAIRDRARLTRANERKIVEACGGLRARGSRRSTKLGPRARPGVSRARSRRVSNVKIAFERFSRKGSISVLTPIRATRVTCPPEMARWSCKLHAFHAATPRWAQRRGAGPPLNPHDSVGRYLEIGRINTGRIACILVGCLVRLGFR